MQFIFFRHLKGKESYKLQDELIITFFLLFSILFSKYISASVVIPINIYKNKKMMQYPMR